MIEALSLEFVQHAIMAGLLTSIACGIIGTLVVVNRIVFISGGIAHAAYGGIGIAFFFGFSPTIGAMGFALGVACLLAVITFKERQRADTVIGVIWAAGMALGIILIDLTPGYNVDLLSFLFGSILTVPVEDLYLMTGMNVIIFAVMAFYFREILALSYDEEFAFTVGVPVRLLYFILLALIALAVVMIIRVVGLILVIALLTVPPYIAERHSGSLLGMMVRAFLLSSVFVLVGLWFSFAFDLTSGATIILVASATFLLDLGGTAVFARIRGYGRKAL